MSADANAQAAAALVSGLVHAGLVHVVLSPGSRNTPLTLAFADHAELAVTSVLDERAAAFFALGLARSSGGPVALCCTSGSAAAHYLPALVEAEASRVPLVVLTADRPAELQHCGAPQTMDQRRLFGAFVRWSADVPAPVEGHGVDHLVTLAAQAVGYAQGTPAGPVHLNCAFRKPLWASAASAPHAASRAPRWERGHRALGEESLDRLAERLSGVDRGVIVCGPHGADTETLAQGVRDLAARLRWPLLVAAGSGVRFAADTPEVVSTYDVFLRGELSAVLEADCVLRFGQWATSGPLATWLSRQPNTVLVSADGARHDPTHSAAVWVDAPATALVDGLCARIPRQGGDPPWLQRWRVAEETSRRLIAEHSESQDWEGAVARAVVSALPDGAALHLANSMPIREVNALCPPDGRRLHTYVSRGVNGIDGTLATAAGEAVGGGRAVTVLVGDLAFLHDLGGLLVAASQPVTFVVVDNGGGGIFGFLPIARHERHFETLFRTPQSVDLSRLCAGAGVRYERVEDLSTLSTAVSREHERSGAGVVHVEIDPALNLRRHQALWDAVDVALKGQS